METGETEPKTNINVELIVLDIKNKDFINDIEHTFCFDQSKR